MKILVAIIFACAMPALADSPLTPASIQTTTSANKRFEVVSHPTKGTKCVEISSSKELWNLPGWYRRSFICDDGRHFITAYPGLNLLSVDYKGSDVMLTFWDSGKIIKTVTVDDLIPNKKILQRTVSHYSWGSVSGINEAGLLEVTLVDGSKILYQPKTGARVNQ